MLCARHARKTNTVALLNTLSKWHYSRRSDNNTNSYKVVQANAENIDDVDGAMLGINSNWELLTPRGFRFYLPGGIGPGWSDVRTTVQVRSQFLEPSHSDAQASSVDSSKKKPVRRSFRAKSQHPMLHCTVQECPLLLRKGIEELFPGCLDVGSAQLSIITISQAVNAKFMRWNKEVETEKLAKYFVLAASDVCEKLRKTGYWADFINPFSGQPHLNLQKNSSLYKTDQRFRCLGFKVLHRNSCKVISHDNSQKNFLGSLYTTAPASTEFLKEILRDCELINMLTKLENKKQ